MEEKVTFIDENGEEQEFTVIEQTVVGGRTYLLVAESDDEEAECLILKDVSEEGDAEADYRLLEDEQEIDAIAAIFEHLLEDEYTIVE
jgi:uncharacterized protein YrzB (UPF0473 family)